MRDPDENPLSTYQVTRHQDWRELNSRNDRINTDESVDLIANVFANPGTPSINKGPPASRHSNNRSSIPS